MKENDCRDAIPFTQKTLLGERYEITGQLSSSGMCRVYAGTDRKSDRQVRLLQYTPDEGKLTADEFVAQVRAIASIRGIANVCSICDLVKNEEACWAVLAAPCGMSLEQRRPETARMLAAVPALLAELQHLHAAGWIHRGISPGNIYYDDHMGILGLDGMRIPFFKSASGRFRDMPENGYAALEQYSGFGREDGRTDIYSLCASLYAVLSGTVPPSAPERAIRCLNMDMSVVPEGWRPILEKGLMLTPDQRWGSAEEMRKACLEQLKHERTPVQGGDLLHIVVAL